MPLVNFTQYIQDVKRTESVIPDLIVRNNNILPSRFLHAVMGIVTEAGELMDATKRATFYGKAIDGHNVLEEIGDLMWYVAVLVDESGLDMQGILDVNIAKLRVRHPSGFTEEAALNRDLTKEREVLEGK